MKNMTVFFPGKFHPPHLGHAKTILQLIPKYDKVIVGVSGDVPEDAVTTVDTIYNIIKELFTPFPNVEVIKFFGVLVEKKDAGDLPEFDVLLSGNPDVLAWGERVGVSVEFIPRSEGHFFSGTEIRDELRDS
jgi:nicotinamide mononucleotide adenylyltransferase